MTAPVFMSHADNLLRNTTPAADSAATSYPASNITILPVSKPYRSAEGVTDAKILFDFASPQSMDMVALVAHNLTATASIVWRAGTASDPDGSEWQVTVPWLSPTCYFQSPATYRYWSLNISDSGNPDGRIEIGYVMAGLSTAFPMVFQPGWNVQWNHVNQVAENDIGVPMVGLNLSSYRVLEMEFLGLSESEATTVENYLQALKMNLTPTLVVTNQAAGVVIFGRLIEPFDINRPNGQVDITGLEFQEDPVLRVISGGSVASAPTGTPFDTSTFDSTQFGA